MGLTCSPWFCPTHPHRSHSLASQRPTSSVSPPSESVSTSLWFLISFFSFHPHCIPVPVPSPFHALMNFSPAKSLSAVLLSILYLTSQLAFSICSPLHLSCTSHCLPLRMNADKEANVDEMMLRMCFRIEGRIREVGVLNWDLEGQLPTH